MQPTNIYYKLQCNNSVKEEYLHKKMLINIILSYYIKISLNQLSQTAIY